MTSHVKFSRQDICLPKSSSPDRNIVEGDGQPANQNEFFKLNVIGIVDTETVVAGVLLVSPVCIAFCPDVTLRAFETHMVAFIEDIVSVALYKQLRDSNISCDDNNEDCTSCDKNVQHSRGEIYRGEPTDNETSKQISTTYVDLSQSHCLCLKLLPGEAIPSKKLVNKCRSSILPDNIELNENGEREFWFSISRSMVANLYKCFVEWMPEKYANFEIFSDVQVPNIHATSGKSVSHISSSTSSEDYENNIEDYKNNIKKFSDHVKQWLCEFNEKMAKLMLHVTNFRANIAQHCVEPGTIWYEIAEYYKERAFELAKEKNEMKLYCQKMEENYAVLVQQCMKAKDKRDLLKKRKNNKIRKINDGVIKAENVAGFRGQKSIENILEFIEGGSVKTNKKNPIKKKEKNNLAKKKDAKKCDSCNFSDINVVKSSKNIKNYSKFSVDEFGSYNGEISNHINSFSTKHDFYDSENSEHEEYLTDFTPVSRKRLPKFKSYNVTETKPVIVSKNNFEKPALSRKSENEKIKSKETKKIRLNPYTWPLILLKPENYKVDDSESGKVATLETINVANSSNFSLDEIKKKPKNEKFSTPNEPLSNGPISTAGKNKAPFELTPVSDHCHVLSFRYYDDICEYKKIARKLDMMCNNAEK